MDRVRGAGAYEVARGGIAAVPTTHAALSTTRTVLYGLYIDNPTAGALDFSLKNGALSTIYKVITVAAKSSVALDFPCGNVFPAGIGWLASGSGMFADVVAYKSET